MPFFNDTILYLTILYPLQHMIETTRTIETNINYPEPAKYDEMFYYSTGKSFLYMFLAVPSFGLGFLILPVGAFLIITAIFLFYMGYRQWSDKSPILKLASEGLWTRELGFKPWSAIESAKVQSRSGSKTFSVWLEIRLKDQINGTGKIIGLNDISGSIDKVQKCIDRLNVQVPI